MSQYILLSEFFPPQAGGIEDSLEQLIPTLGRDLIVVTPDSLGSQTYDQPQPFTIFRRSLFSGRVKPGWLWLLPWLWSRRRSTDLVIFGHFSAAVFAAWFLWPFGLRYVVFVHGNDLLSELARPIRRWLIRSQLGRATWIGTNSDFTAKQIHHLGVPWSRIIKLFPMVPDHALARSADHQDQQRLITVCRLVKRKNVEAVIWAVAELVKELPQLRYDIVGDGSEKHRLQGLIVQLGLTTVVTLHGHLSNQDKWQLLEKSTVAVMTPLTSGAEVEGLGLFYLEASALGLPIVASHGGGVDEAVVDNTTGLLVSPTDHLAVVAAIRRLLLDHGLRQRLGQAGQQHVAQEFTAGVRVERFARLIKRQQQNNPPLVSIIIPAYQSADTMTATLNDVFNQTWPHTEIIIVDDGSTDQLESALAPYRQRLTVLKQTNQGAAAARNTGAAKATGDFFLFLDADMRLDRDMITMMVAALQTHPNVSYVYSNFQFGPKGFRLFEFNSARLKKQNYIHTSSLIRRADFPGFDPKLKKFQDWDLWLTMLEHDRHGLWLPLQLFRVQQRAGGMSTWLPRLVYRLPFIGQGRGSATIRKYREAEEIIRRKHHLS